MELKLFSYNYIVDRINKVIDSCETKKQLDTSRDYISILLCRQNMPKNICPDDWFFEKRRRSEHLLKYFAVKVKKKKLSLQKRDFY